MDIARKMRRQNNQIFPAPAPRVPSRSDAHQITYHRRYRCIHVWYCSDAKSIYILPNAHRICCRMTEELCFASPVIMQVLQMLVNRSVLPVNLSVSIWTGWERRRSGAVNGGGMGRMDIDYTNAGHCKCYVCGHTCCLF